jgi:hypothetical protein
LEYLSFSMSHVVLYNIWFDNTLKKSMHS